GTQETWRDRIGLATLSTIAAAAAAALPYLAGFGSVEGYGSVLLMAAKQGLSGFLLKCNLLLALMLVAPIAFALYSRRSTLNSFDSCFLAGLFVSLVLTTILASKPGAGVHHFLPFIPIALFGLLAVLESPSSNLEQELKARELGTILLVTILIFYAPGAV